MSKYLNIGIIQNSGATDYEANMKRFSSNVDDLMNGLNKPELIVGSESAIGFHWKKDINNHDTIPGKLTDYYGKIAKKYGIYFIPGTMTELKIVDGEEKLYNSMPIFGPDGLIINVYRKMCPYYPAEEYITIGTEYVVFEIAEKEIKIGVMNCHDWCFPEISRNLTLLGAEILIKLSADPVGLYENCKTIPPTRAFENQAYFISVNMAGYFNGYYSYGHSMIVGPDAQILYEAGDNPTFLTWTFDLDLIRKVRVHGTNYTEQLLRQLKHFKIKMPFADNIEKAPVFKNLPDYDLTRAEREEKFKNAGIMTIGHTKNTSYKK
ncbi:MAG: carbon-nitrogen hydrolase family protein [Desulfobacterales bacterium]|nr:carbon-nitrogen hydrolase family protein [Desulfobacterales bacterium]